MTVALTPQTWAALALDLPSELRGRIVAALRGLPRNDRTPVAISLTTEETHLVDLRLRRLAR